MVNFFGENEIPYKENLIGFASDSCNVMFGAKNSVVTLLKKDVPSLFAFKCICHSLALCVSHATEELPPEVELLVREVYSYVKNSSKRQKHLNTFIRLLELPKHKLLKFFKIRWLSMLECVKRVLELYPALENFFDEEAITVPEAKLIQQRMKNRFNLLFLQFLEFILPIVVKCNEAFQSEKPQIHRLYNEMMAMYKFILDCYIDSR